jgi:hypothetical protein
MQACEDLPGTGKVQVAFDQRFVSLCAVEFDLHLN